MLDIFGDDNDADIDVDNPLSRSEADDYTPEAFDNYLTAEVIADRGGEILRGTVKSWERDNNGMPIGMLNPNPLLDTREYLVCFEDGTEETYTANLIAECLYLQIDDRGRRLQIMKEIIDHDKHDKALKDEDAFYPTKSGPRPKCTTRGWKLLVEWNDGTNSWVPLRDLVDSYPVELTDYAATNN